MSEKVHGIHYSANFFYANFSCSEIIKSKLFRRYSDAIRRLTVQVAIDSLSRIYERARNSELNNGRSRIAKASVIVILQSRSKPRRDRLQKRARFQFARRHVGAENASQIARHIALLDGTQRRLLQAIRKRAQLRVVIEFPAFAQRAAPCKNRRDRIGRSRAAVAVFVIMPRYGAVRRFVFVLAVGRNEHGRHHRKRAERRRDPARRVWR